MIFLECLFYSLPILGNFGTILPTYYFLLQCHEQFPKLPLLPLQDSQCQAELYLQAFLLMGQCTMILTILVCDL